MENKKMKICLAAPSHAYQYYGGGEVLLDKTCEYLKAKGLDVKLFDYWKDRVEDFDIVHFFGIGYFNYEFLNTARSKNKKLIITPIFPTVSGTKNVARMAYHNLCFIVPFLKTPPELMRRNAGLADLILASSEIEKKQVCELLKAHPGKVKIAHYGADKKFLDSTPEAFVDKYDIKDFVLCVARFDSRQKNQLNLVRALKGSDARMVFVGKPDKGMEDYYALCKKEAPEGTLFIDYLDQGGPMLGSCYAAARTFAVPSKFEYPGLAAMEAILAGCKRLAITKFGSTKEYYKDFARYFDPYNLKDIREAVLSAHNSDIKGDKAREYFKNNCLWENYAEKLAIVYKELL